MTFHSSLYCIRTGIECETRPDVHDCFSLAFPINDTIVIIGGTSSNTGISTGTSTGIRTGTCMMIVVVVRNIHIEI